MYGYNVPSGDSFESLRGLATSPTRSVASSEFELFSSFFGNDDYADVFFLKVLLQEPPFDSLSTAQVAQQASDMLRFSVLYMAILESVYGAIAVCRGGGDAEERVFLIDRAVALYAGSMEGSAASGSGFGPLLFGTSREFCTKFGTCTDEGHSTGNDAAVRVFRALSTALIGGDCVTGSDLVEKVLTPLLLVPLVQGLLGGAVQRSTQTLAMTDSARTRPFSFFMAIVPLLDFADISITSQLAMMLDLKNAGEPFEDGAATVFGLVQKIMPKMVLPDLPSVCPYIGAYPDYPDICQGLTSKFSSLVNATPLPSSTPKASPATLAPVVPPTVVPTTLPPVVTKQMVVTKQIQNNTVSKSANKKKGKKMNGMKMMMNGKKMNGMKMMGKKKAEEFATETETEQDEDESNN